MIRLAILAPTPALRSGLRTLLAADERIQVLAEAAAPAALDDLGALDVLLVAGESYSLESLRSALESTEAPPALLLLSEETSRYPNSQGNVLIRLSDSKRSTS